MNNDTEHLHDAGISDRDRTLCEVWTRVMGYHRPVSCFNPGKQGEHEERRFFKEKPCPTGTPST